MNLYLNRVDDLWVDVVTIKYGMVSPWKANTQKNIT